MKQVDIYITAGIRAPAKGTGRVMYIMRTKRSNGTIYESLPSVAELDNATENRLVLSALWDALQRLNYACAVTAYTESLYIGRAVNSRWPEKWEKDGWKNAKGKEVKDSILWRRVLHLLEGTGCLPRPAHMNTAAGCAGTCPLRMHIRTYSAKSGKGGSAWYMTKHGGFWGSANKDTYSKSNKSSTGAGKGAQGMDRRQLTLGSLFDGIAGFPLAAAEAGIRTAWTSEVKPACIRISARHFPEAEQLGDITKLDGAAVPPVDIISFGSPCQNLSAAGDREGLCGEKSKLFFEEVRIIDGMRSATNGRYPKYVIWENVAGAFSSNKGEDFRRVLEEITKASIPMPRSGRWAAAGMVGDSGGSTAWRMLDAQYWGVPQRRKRIYLVRSFGNGRAGQILFECESVLGYSAQGRGEAEGDTAGIEDCVTGTDSGGLVQDADGQMTLDFGSAGNRVYINAKKSVALKATDGGGGASTGLYLLPVYTVAGNIIGRTGKNGGNQLGIKGDGISPTLTVNDRRAVIYAPEEMQCPAAYMQHGYSGYKKGVGTLRGSRGTNGGGSETLIVNKKKGIKLLKYSVRRLMPVECERLNGFPDGWT